MFTGSISGRSWFICWLFCGCVWHRGANMRLSTSSRAASSAMDSIQLITLNFQSRYWRSSLVICSMSETMGRAWWKSTLNIYVSFHYVKQIWGKKPTLWWKKSTMEAVYSALGNTLGSWNRRLKLWWRGFVCSHQLVLFLTFLVGRTNLFFQLQRHPPSHHPSRG